MSNYADRVKETTTTTGTGTVDLAGTTTGYRTFVAGIGNGNACYYAIAHQAADEWEVGIGTVTDAAPDTLSRTTVLASSNAGSLVNFTAGTKDAFVTIPAAQVFKGPATAVDNTVVRYDGTTGKVAQGSTVVIDDLGTMTINPGTSPIDGLILGMAQPVINGTRNSHNLLFQGTSYDGSGHTVEFKQNIDVAANDGSPSYLMLRSRLDAGAWTDIVYFQDGGQVYFPGSSGATLGIIGIGNFQGPTTGYNLVIGTNGPNHTAIYAEVICDTDSINGTTGIVTYAKYSAAGAGSARVYGGLLQGFLQSASSGTVAELYGCDVLARNASSSTIATLVSGVRIKILNGSGTMTQRRGLSISDWTTSGTVTTSYGIYIDTSIDTGTTKYAIYSLSTSGTFLSGNAAIVSPGVFSQICLYVAGNTSATITTGITCAPRITADLSILAIYGAGRFHTAGAGAATATGGQFVAEATSFSSGTVAALYGVVTNITNSAAGTTITQVRGLSISDWANSGSITTSYGIYIDSSIDVGSTKYAVYSLSTSPSLLSGNLTINGAFGSEQAPALTAGNWTVGTGWESPIVGPGLIKNADGTGTQTPSAATTIVAGTTYKVVITLSAWSVGSATYSLGSNNVTSTLSAATTYTDYVTALTTGKLIITPTNTSRFTISAISITPITAAIGDLTVGGAVTIQSTLSVEGYSRFDAPIGMYTAAGGTVPGIRFYRYAPLGDETAFDFTLYHEGPNSLNGIAGVGVTVGNESSTSISFLSGYMSTTANDIAAGSVGTMRGIYNFSRNSGTVTSWYSHIVDAYNGLVVTDYWGMWIRFRNGNASATAGTVRGISMTGWTNTGGTTSTSYGIYMDTSIDIGTTRYAFYSLSTSPSLLSGTLRIDGTVGIKGAPGSSNSQFYISPGTLASAGTHRGMYVVADLSAGSLSSLYGYQLDITSSGSQNITTLSGFQITVTHQSSGTATTIIGTDQNISNASGNTVSGHIGQRSQLITFSGSTSSTLYAYYASVQTSGTGIITTGSGLLVTLINSGTTGDFRGINLSDWSNSGTVTTSYGIYISASIDIGATRFAIYSLSTSPSLLTGNLSVSGGIIPRTASTASSAAPTPNADTTDQYILTALAVGATFGAPTGTPVQGQRLLIRIKDNTSAQTLAWNAIYRAIGVTLPVITVSSKTLYVGAIYNSTDVKWDVLAVGAEA